MANGVVVLISADRSSARSKALDSIGTTEIELVHIQYPILDWPACVRVEDEVVEIALQGYTICVDSWTESASASSFPSKHVVGIGWNLVTRTHGSFSRVFGLSPDYDEHVPAMVAG